MHLPNRLNDCFLRKRMKFWITGSLFFLLTVVSYAQQPAKEGQPNKEGQQRIRAAKITWITNRLNLTPDQAKDFWPLFNECEDKKREIRHRLRRLNGETNNLNASDETIRKNLKEVLDLRQQEVDLEREYQTKYLKVLNVKQLSELYKADQRFTQMLIERLNNRPHKEQDQH